MQSTSYSQRNIVHSKKSLQRSEPESIKTKNQIIDQQIGTDGQQKITRLQPTRLIRSDVKRTEMDGSPRSKDPPLGLCGPFLRDRGLHAGRTEFPSVHCLWPITKYRPPRPLYCGCGPVHLCAYFDRHGDPSISVCFMSEWTRRVG